MSASPPLRIPMPLRVPELAPSLGRLIVPRRLREPWIPLDDVRDRLATRVLELGGAARAAAMREQREQVLDAVSRAAWAQAWEEALQTVAARLAAAIDDALARTARSVRMPRARWRRRLLAGGEKRAIATRLAAGGGPLIEALDALEEAGGRARAASVLESGAHEEWQEALRTAARRLEAAWLALEDEVAAERERWLPEIAAIAAWRPALWPVVALWVPLAAALCWLGLVLGGYLAAPVWLAERLGF